MRKHLFYVCLFFASQCMTQAPSPILFIYDASGSMWQQIDGTTKKELAQDVLTSTVSNFSEDQPIGLVAYGHRRKGDCADVETLVASNNTSKQTVTNAIRSINPIGKTPLAASAKMVIDQLRTKGNKATIILITDGIESCDGDLCAVIEAAKAEGIEFRMHIVGFGLQGADVEALRCAAKAGDGQYYDAQNADDLTAGLEQATQTTVDDPASNFTVYALRNEEPIDVTVRVFRAGTEELMASQRTYRDTAHLFLPEGKYDIIAQPLASSSLKPQRIEGVQQPAAGGGHQTVSFDAGKVAVMVYNNEEGWDAVVRIYPDGVNRAAAGGRTYGVEKEYELDPGTYDIEVKAMRMDGMSKVYRKEGLEVVGNKTIEFEHRFASGKAMIGVKKGSVLVDAVISIRDPETNTQLAGGRTYKSDSSNPKAFTLNPGTYNVTINPLGEHAGPKQTKQLTVKQNETVELIFNL